MTPEEYLASKNGPSKPSSDFAGAAEYLEAKKPGILEDIGIRLGKRVGEYETGLRNFADAYTGGLTEKSDVAGTYIADKIMGGNKSFKDVQNEKNARMAKLNEENPIMATLGTLTGYVAPTGAFSNITKGVSNIPAVKKLIGASEVGGKGIQFLKQLTGASARGGTSGAVMGQLQEDLPTSVSDIPENLEKRVKRIPGDFETGAEFDAGAFAGGKAISGIAETPFAKTIVKAAKKLPEKLPFGIGDTIKEMRADKFAGKVSDIAKQSGVEDPLIAGRAAATSGADIQKAASEKYLKLKSGMLRKFGKSKASAEILRQGIDEELKGFTELASDLDPDIGKLKPVLEKWQAKLYSNPTIHELDDITTTLYNLKGKQNANPAFNRLYKAARENLMAAMDEAAVSAGRNTTKYKSAVRASQEAGDMAASAENEAKALAKSKNMFPTLPVTKDAKMLSKMKAQTSSKFKDMDEVVNALDAENEQMGEAARKAYQEAREEIAKNLKIKDGSLGKLIEHGKEFPSEVSEKARTIGRLDLPEVVDEALGVNAGYRDTMRKAVLSDVIEHAKDEKGFQAWLKKYKYTLPKLFAADELNKIEKVSGIGKSEVSFIKKLAGVNNDPGFAEMLPRALSPLMTNRKEVK